MKTVPKFRDPYREAEADMYNLNQKKCSITNNNNQDLLQTLVEKFINGNIKPEDFQLAISALKNSENNRGNNLMGYS